MIKAIIIDDEQHNRTVLKTLLYKYCPNIKIISDVDNADDGFKQIEALKPELVFLDVKMPNKSGFDMLKMFSHINFEVIFVSAFDQYAIHAFEFSALDYILKPIDYTKLVKAVNKAFDKIELGNGNQNVFHFIKTLDEKTDLIKKLSLHHNDKVVLVDVNDICFIESKADFCQIHLSDKQLYNSSKDIGLFEDILSPTGIFLRINRNILINTRFIKSYSKGETCFIELKSGEQFEASRRKKTEIISKLKPLFS
jgi:two-component system, LytTR family, response regulator